MFYKDSLQSAINEAIRDSKLVVSFVTDHGEESISWENEFLQDQLLKKSLSERSILLKLEAGSIEAGYLAAIFPLPKTPVLIIIQNGQLKEYISPGVSKQDFVRRTLSVFKDSSVSTSIVPTPVTPADTPTSFSQPLIQASSSTTNDSRGQKQDGNGDNKPNLIPSSRNNIQTYALMQKRRLQEAKDERAIILKRVEEDKALRREEAALRKVERQCSTETSPLHDSPPTATSLNSRDTCALLIRLFDGSTLRTKFPSHATLSSEVRTYISTYQPSISDRPYTFKYILSPASNRTIEATEESHSLRDLGCVPSATFILTPVEVYTNAYVDSGTGAAKGGIIEEVASSGWRAISGGIRMVTGTLGSYIGAGGDINRAGNTHQTDRNNQSGLGNAPTFAELEVAGNNTQTHEQQFYNGNSINFQPRPKNDYENRKNE
ncbi:hypothetical protein K3495_g7189 [Podosphaera aphanis]|nr:hypothetical protein K3495_g7189 [Podosphaera aphanis]